MTIFYIDTTSSYLYTGIVKDQKLLIEKKENLGKRLSIDAISIVADMFNEINLKPSDIDKIIVVNGPGSFTGIRIGVTIAKIMAWAKNIAITTITSLEAMAQSFHTNKLIVPIINARRESCYAAIYDNNKEIMKGAYMPIEKLKMFLLGLNKEYVFISNDYFSFEVQKYNPNIERIVNYYQNKASMNPHLVNPMYLKLTEAEENRIKNND